jgi:hypothetical protein
MGNIRLGFKSVGMLVVTVVETLVAAKKRRAAVAAGATPLRLVDGCTRWARCCRGSHAPSPWAGSTSTGAAYNCNNAATIAASLRRHTPHPHRRLAYCSTRLHMVVTRRAPRHRRFTSGEVTLICHLSTLVFDTGGASNRGPRLEVFTLDARLIISASEGCGN